MLDRIRCERFEFGNIRRDFSLKIAHVDARGFCASIHLISWMPVLFAGAESELNDSGA
jgi:hypothetical protein